MMTNMFVVLVKGSCTVSKFMRDSTRHYDDVSSIYHATSQKDSTIRAITVHEERFHGHS